MAQTQSAEPELVRAFKDTMRRFPATVTVITARLDGRDHGMTATAVTSVSMDPPSLVVVVNNRTLLHEMLLSTPHFTVNVLTLAQVDQSRAFSGQTPPEDRFAAGAWVRNDHGLMQLADAQANVTCKRMAAMPYGTHTLFIGQVVAASVRPSVESLIYENATYCAARPVA